MLRTTTGSVYVAAVRKLNKITDIQTIHRNHRCSSVKGFASIAKKYTKYYSKKYVLTDGERVDDRKRLNL